MRLAFRLATVPVLMLGTACATAQHMIDIERVKIRSVPEKKATPDVGKNTLSTYSTLAMVPVEGMAMVLGAGYDAIRDEVIPTTCVIATEGKLDEDIGADKLIIADHYEYINTVSTMAGHQSSAGSSGGFSFAYKLVSLGANVAEGTSNYFNNIDSFARIYTRYITRSQERFDGTWADEGIQVEANASDKRPFVDHCGTHYISKIYYGSLIDQTLRFKLNENKRDKANQQSANIGLGEIFSINGGTEATETSLSSLTQLSIVKRTKGVPVPGQATPSLPSAPATAAQPAPATTAQPTPPAAASSSVTPVSAAVQFARKEYADLVRKSDPKSAQLLFVEIQPYRRLRAEGSNKVPEIPLALMATLQAKSGLYNDLISNILTMKQVQGFADADFQKFFAGNVTDVPKIMTRAEDLRTRFFNAVDKCGQAISLYYGPLPPDAVTKCTTDLDVLTNQNVVDASLVPK